MVVSTRKTYKVTPKKEVKKNPIAQMIEDQKRIIDATRKGKPMSSVKGVKFVKPL